MGDDSISIQEEELLSDGNENSNIADDHDISAMEAQVAEFEEEQQKLKQIQSDIEGQLNISSASSQSGLHLPTPEEKAETDARSVYVGNVDYGTTAEELEKHFHGCGSVARVTILCDKFTGHPKGFAYVEFADRDGASNAVQLSDSLLRGRQIKVSAKRTNKPGISSTNRPPRGFFRGRGRGMRSRGVGAYAYGGFRPRGRGMRRPGGFTPF